MTEKELIEKIQGFKGIKPEKDWVILTKKEILGEKPKIGFSFFFKPALAGALTLCILGGVFVFAQGALPGDSLYPLKKVAEKARLSFVSEKERPNLQLEYANEKLESLAKVVQNKQTKKVTLIIKEYQANVSEAAKSLEKVETPNVKEIVEGNKRIEENREKIEALGVRLGETKEWDNALARIVESEIKYWEKSTLSESQLEIFEQVKEDYQDGSYSEALEKILLLSYPQER